LALSVGIFSDISAQSRKDTAIVITAKTDLDLLFKQARQIGEDGNHERARKICQKILDYKPDYYEVRTYIGRTYAWDKQYDNARTEFSRVLIEKENDIEAICGIVDVELWANHLDIAGDYILLGLGYSPASEELLLRKARWHLRQGDQQSAATTIRKILDLDPANKDAVDLEKSMRSIQLKNKLQWQYSVDFFNREYDPQQWMSVEYGRNFSFGSVSARVNGADRFGNQGLQIEVESYARISRKSYMNLLAGHSLNGAFPFPEQNFVAEIYHKLPKGFEGSAGIRYLKFTENTLIYTGSISIYSGDYWFSLRPFITPQSSYELPDGTTGTKVSKTYFLRGRRYLSEAEHYVGIRLGYGESPDDRRYFNQIRDVYLTTFQAGGEWQKRIYKRIYLKADLNYAHEELRKDDIYQRFSVNLQARTTF
ncbi:MAG: YaiO family outer membrane beta-barrel protein, partial [Bacteroidota bacterium]